MLRPLAVVLMTLAPLPVAAGQIERTLAPRTQAQALALTLGIAAASLHRHIEDGGSARGWARANAEGLRDPRRSDWALVHQDGDGHAARVAQRGGGNALALLQFGSGALAEIAQGGGESGLTIQLGW